MTLLNVIDCRKRFHRWRFVDAIIEPTWHDNCVQDADIVEKGAETEGWIGYDERFKISLAEAIKWAQEHPDNVTLFLYDVGGNTVSKRS